MPTITQTLALEDRVSPVLDRIISRMDRLMSVMGALDGTSEKVLDPNTFSRSASAIDKTSDAASRLQSAIQGVGDKGSMSMGDIASSAEDASGEIRGTITETGNLSNTLATLGHSAQIFQTITDLVSKARGALGSIGLDVMNFDRMMTRQDSARAFSRTIERVTGDAQKASEVTQSVLEGVRGTAYGLDNATTGVKQFVNAGMEIEKSISVVDAWKDAVSGFGYGTNESFDRVMLSLSQMVTAGKVNGADMMSILQQGIPVWEIYADAVGMSTSEAKDALTSGKVGVQDFLDTMTSAFTEGTTRFASVAGAAKGASDDWANTLANMGTAVARGQEKIVAGADLMIAEVMGEGNNVRTLLQDIAAGTEAGLGKVGTLLQEYGPGVAKFFNSMVSGLKALDKHTPIIKILVGGLAGLAILGTINKLGAVTVSVFKSTGAAITATIAPLKRGGMAMKEYAVGVRMAAREAKMMATGPGGGSVMSRNLAGVSAGFKAATTASSKFATALGAIGKATIWMAAIEAVFLVGQAVYDAYAARAEDAARRVEHANERMGNISSQVSSSLTSSMETALQSAVAVAETKAPLDDNAKAVGLAASMQGTYAGAVGKTNNELARQSALLSDTKPMDQLKEALASSEGEFAKSGMLDLYAQAGINLGDELDKAYRHAIDSSAEGADLSGMRKKLEGVFDQQLKIPADWMDFAATGKGLEMWRKDQSTAMRQWQSDVAKWAEQGPSFVEKMFPPEDQTRLNELRGQLLEIKNDTALDDIGKNSNMTMVLQDISRLMDEVMTDTDLAGQAMSIFGDVSEQTSGAVKDMANARITNLTGDLDEGAESGEQMAESLDKVLEALKEIHGLNDPFHALQKAKADWQELKRETKKDIFGDTKGDKVTKSGNVNLKTESGAALNDALIKRADAAEKIIESMVRADASAGDIQQKAQSLVSQFEKFGESAGVSQSQLEQYLSLDGLVPPAIDIPVKADMSEADSQIASMSEVITALGFDPINFEMNADGTAAMSEVDNITARLDDGGNLIISGDTTKAIEQLDGAVTQINGTTGTLKVVIGSGVAGEISRVEGMLNNATRARTVTITVNEVTGSKVPRRSGGPITSSMTTDVLHRASGGGISGPGGPRDDKIPVMASDGEWMNKASTVKKVGGFAGMRKLTRMIDSGVLKLAKGGPVIKDRTYSSKTLQNRRDPKEYLDQRAQRHYTKSYQSKFNMPIRIGSVNNQGDVKKLLKEIERSVREASQSAV